MKKTCFNIGFAALLTAGVMMLSGCSQDDLLMEESSDKNTLVNEGGTFTATFVPNMYEPMSRAAVQTTSTAVQSLKYLIYKENENGDYLYFTEGDLFGFDENINETANESIKWPYTDKIQVELPGGNYKVAFVANTNPKLFGAECNELLTYDKEGSWNQVRLNMPDIPFGDNNMFYMDAVEVSTGSPTAQVWLERVVCKVQLWRETVASDNGFILTELVENVFDHLQGDAPITGLLSGDLGTAISGALGAIGVDKIEDLLLEPILKGVTEALKPAIVDYLTMLLDTQLKANNKYALLGQLTNPWSWAGAGGAVLTFEQVPNAINLEGKVTGYYTKDTQYACELKEDGNFHYLELTGLADSDSQWKIGKIDVISSGLVGRILVDDFLEDYILTGSLIDTGSDLTYTFGSNYKYKSVYGAITLNVKENFHDQNTGEPNLKVHVTLGDILDLEELLTAILDGERNNTTTTDRDTAKDFLESLKTFDLLGAVGSLIDGLLGGLLGDILSPVTTTVGELVGYLIDGLGLNKILTPLVNALTGIEVNLELPLNINALGIETLEATGTWGEVQQIP